MENMLRYQSDFCKTLLTRSCTTALLLTQNSPQKTPYLPLYEK